MVDLYLPNSRAPGAATDVVIAVHGGFWRDTVDRVHARPMAVALRDSGFAVVIPEYRRANPSTPGWPVALQDLQLALACVWDWFRAEHIEVGRVVLTGHSAGGHLALMLSRAPVFDSVIPLAPVADLAAAEMEHLGEGAVEIFMGGPRIESPDAYAQADPALALQGNPLTARICILHGTDDDIVPVANSRSFVRQVPDARLLEFAGIGHFELIDPEHEVWDAVLREIAGASGARTSEPVH
jgi:acetyl esterase/lipase